MTPKLKRASTVAVAATMIAAIASAQGSGAIAQIPADISANLAAIQLEPVFPSSTGQSPVDPSPARPVQSFVSQPVVQKLPISKMATSKMDGLQDAQTTVAADTLDKLVDAQSTPEELSSEMRCLAGAIYFEAKSESLPGQLAVGRVVVNRSKSGRFPGSYCGVVYQPSQFSFVRGRSMPAIKTNSQDWRDAVAIAQIAHGNSWKSPAEGALFFHATRVSPGWRLTRLARVDNHVFYR